MMMASALSSQVPVSKFYNQSRLRSVNHWSKKGRCSKALRDLPAPRPWQPRVASAATQVNVIWSALRHLETKLWNMLQKRMGVNSQGNFGKLPSGLNFPSFVNQQALRFSMLLIPRHPARSSLSL